MAMASPRGECHDHCNSSEGNCHGHGESFGGIAMAMAIPRG